MAPVKMPKAVLRIFNQYDEKKIKELDETEAIYMLRAEFLLTPEQALGVFNSFDIDKNGKMSLSEFYQFYKLLGEHLESKYDKKNSRVSRINPSNEAGTDFQGSERSFRYFSDVELVQRHMFSRERILHIIDIVAQDIVCLPISNTTHKKLSKELLEILYRCRSQPVVERYTVYSLFVSIEDIVKKFKTMDKDGNGVIDRDEAGLGLKGLKTGKGKIIQDQDIDFLMKAFAGDSDVINLGDFSKLLQKLKVYDGSELAD